MTIKIGKFCGLYDWVDKTAFFLDLCRKRKLAGWQLVRNLDGILYFEEVK